MRAPVKTILYSIAFVLAYVALDWASFLHPLYGLNITPWNPSLALGLVFWLRVGRGAALPWLLAIIVGDLVIRGMPPSVPAMLAASVVLVLVYGAMGETLRRVIHGDFLLGRRHLVRWLVVVVLGTLVGSIAYVLALTLSGQISVRDWSVAFIRFWIGDAVGIVVTMPFFWLVVSSWRRLLTLFGWETAAYTSLSVAMLWVAFGLGGQGEFQYFYLLCVPLVWAAARQGVQGAAICAFVLQAGIIAAVQWQNLVAVTVFELQMLGMVLAFVGLFIGVEVDEKQRLGHELQQTLRLAAAGEMAAALAHELNQPLTALGTYGAACELLLDQNADPGRLRDTILRMVGESRRAAEVVRRLRDFFRTGATQLERLPLRDLVKEAVAQCIEKATARNVDLLVDEVPEGGLLADHLQLQVVLRNLLDNAFDAIDARSEGRRYVGIAVVVSGGMATIRVRDSGRGLTSAQADALFEPFRSSKSSGLGLGLVISRAIARAHGGELEAVATRTGGLFVLSLPIEKE